MSATPVAPARVVELSRTVMDCAICGQHAGWYVDGTRVCRDHVGAELERRYEVDPYPFTPPLALPARSRRGNR